MALYIQLLNSRVWFQVERKAIVNYEWFTTKEGNSLWTLWKKNCLIKKRNSLKLIDILGVMSWLQVFLKNQFIEWIWWIGSYFLCSGRSFIRPGYENLEHWQVNKKTIQKEQPPKKKKRKNNLPSQNPKSLYYFLAYIYLSTVPPPFFFFRYLNCK